MRLRNEEQAGAIPVAKLDWLGPAACCLAPSFGWHDAHVRCESLFSAGNLPPVRGPTSTRFFRDSSRHAKFAYSRGAKHRRARAKSCVKAFDNWDISLVDMLPMCARKKLVFGPVLVFRPARPSRL